MNRELAADLAWGIGLVVLALASTYARKLGYIDAETVTLAVRAHIRHLHTEYDRLRDAGENKRDSRAAVRETIDDVAARWRLATEARSH